MADQMPFPEIPPGLIKRLEEAFPDRVPRNGNERTFYQAQGAQQVLDLLRKHYAKQQERGHVRTA